MVQEVLIFDEEIWVLSVAMYRKLVRFHVVFLKHLTGQRAMPQRDGN